MLQKENGKIPDSKICKTAYGESNLWECRVEEPYGCPYLVWIHDLDCCEHPDRSLFAAK